ncbi:MAG: type VI secretion system baseplate subunit TssK [Alphaproteobacteria bacterium]|nr:type VI secretion system baseplate subunit TssK [Alphaproteobacteria bacterium]
MLVTTRSLICPQIQWHEGMLLSPHHFQQSDLRNHQLMIHHMSLMNPYHWGVRQIKLDPVVLPDGLIRILELEAVMPDGLIISYHVNQADIPPLEFDLKPYKKDLIDGGQLTIQLALPLRHEKASPIVGEFARYWSVEGEEVNDDTAPDNVIKIPRLFPRVQLVASETSPPRTTSFPLMKIRYQNEAFVQTNFLPPLFLFEQGNPILDQCLELVKIIREKASYLSDRWQSQAGTPLAGETAALLRPLISVLPLFESLVHGDGNPPSVFYRQLCLIAGYLSNLRLEQLPPVMPVYKHADLYATFEPILEHMHYMLGTIEKAYASFIFHQRDRLFSLRMHAAYQSDKLYLGMRIPRGMTELQLSDWISDAIIASDDAIDAVRDKRITGARRTLIREGDMYQLVPSRGIILVEVENDPAYIHLDQNLNIFNPADHPDRRPTEIILYVKKGLS